MKNTILKTLIKINYILIILDVYILYHINFVTLSSTKIGDISFLTALYFIYLYIRYKIMLKSILSPKNSVKIESADKREEKGCKTTNKTESNRLNNLKRKVEASAEEDDKISLSLKKSKVSELTVKQVTKATQQNQQKSRFDIAKEKNETKVNDVNSSSSDDGVKMQEANKVQTPQFEDEKEEDVENANAKTNVDNDLANF